MLLEKLYNFATFKIIPKELMDKIIGMAKVGAKNEQRRKLEEK